MKTDNELINEWYASQGGKPALEADISFYESSWDMLMPVVEKIESLQMDVDIRTVWSWRQNEHRKYCTASIFTQPDQLVVYQEAKEGVSKIESVYKAVVEFIKWHSEHTK